MNELISAEALEAMRAEVEAGGGTIEESRDDDGYHVVVTWGSGKTDTFLADI